MSNLICVKEIVRTKYLFTKSRLSNKTLIDIVFLEVRSNVWQISSIEKSKSILRTDIDVERI
jgi:hypothetical protein